MSSSAPEPAPESQPPSDSHVSKSSDAITVRMGETLIRVDRWARGSVEIGPAERSAYSEIERHLKLYSAFRDYVKHEDDLTNNRLNWNFTIQGFLFAAYSFSVQKIVEVRGTLFTKGSVSTELPKGVLTGIRDLQVVNV